MTDPQSISRLTTEAINPNSANLDALNALQLVKLINSEDQLVAGAVLAAAESLAAAVDCVVERLRGGGRLIYIGAGTSGRLGVLDASECPPTYRTPPSLVVGLIAGGDVALRTAVEGDEDSLTQAAEDLRAIELNRRDCVMGIASSGRTPYVIGGLRYARGLGCATLGHTCNASSDMTGECDILITTIVGPEVISGSTRMKSGTATKLVLNTLTTATMVRLGKTYGNLMVDLRATNSKLVLRSERLVMTLTGMTQPNAAALLEQARGEVKVAAVMHHRQVDYAAAVELLSQADGHLRAVIGDTLLTPR
jgi:N-acetylmuramic acid 6-phosphate etherase